MIETSCFELLGSRQHGVARHLEEQPSESNVPPNARGSDLGLKVLKVVAQITQTEVWLREGNEFTLSSTFNR